MPWRGGGGVPSLLEAFWVVQLCQLAIPLLDSSLEVSKEGGRDRIPGVEPSGEPPHSSSWSPPFLPTEGLAPQE